MTLSGNCLSSNLHIAYIFIGPYLWLVMGVDLKQCKRGVLLCSCSHFYFCKSIYRYLSCVMTCP